jgi:transposase
VAEKLDYEPGVFTVERHVRGKWACAHCQTLVQAPVPAHIIDKGIPTAGCWPRCWWPSTDHLPLYRQEGIFERAGLAIPRSTLAQWVGSCGVHCSRWSMRSRPTCCATACCTPTRRRWRCSSRATGKTHRAYLWAYCTGASIRSRRWSTTSPKAARGRAQLPATGQLPGRKAGAARWCATTSPATRRCSSGRHRSRLHGARRRKFFDLLQPTRARSPSEALEPFGQVLYEIEREVAG